jgi:nucleotide-binding universal stress UspA family protein
LYAFGVIWSFAFKALAVLILRFTEPQNREWKVPGNIRIGKTELPIGLALIAIVLFATAIVNLFTKQEATIAGVSFSAVFFGILAISEKVTAKKQAAEEHGLEQFRVFANPELHYSILSVRPGNVLVCVRDPRNLSYLQKVLYETDTDDQDIVVMTARLSHREHSFGGSTYYDAHEVFEHYERDLFSRVVAVAEKVGKPVSLVVIPGTNVFDTILATAQRLEASRVVCGASVQLTTEEQGKLAGDAWERLQDPKPRVVLEIASPNGETREFWLGPHTPRLREQDIELMHRMWREVTSDRGLPRFITTTSFRWR